MKRTFKDVLREKAKKAGCKHPAQYLEFYDCCKYVAEKFSGNRNKVFTEWIKEESYFD